MILDSMKARGFYAFFNGMKFSGTLGLYLVALFMCLGFEVKAVDLPTVGKCDASGWSQGIIDISVERKDQTKLVFEVDQSHKDQMSQLGVIFYFSYPNNVVNLVVDGIYSNGLNVNGDY